VTRRKPRTENPLLTTDHGIATIQAIVDSGKDRHYHVFTVKLDDGDEASLTGEIAQGILMIRDALKPENQERMNRMTLLELLHIYTEAIKDRVLKPSSLRLDPKKR
jgi:hypothetical protein